MRQTSKARKGCCYVSSFEALTTYCLLTYWQKTWLLLTGRAQLADVNAVSHCLCVGCESPIFGIWTFSPGHVTRTLLDPRTIFPPDNSPSLFTWCRTFPSSTIPSANLQYKAIYHVTVSSRWVRSILRLVGRLWSGVLSSASFPK